jgi:hypothetical protein
MPTGIGIFLFCDLGIAETGSPRGLKPPTSGVRNRSQPDELKNILRRRNR